MKISRNEAEFKTTEGLKYWVYNNRTQFAGASAMFFEVTGSHGLTKNTANDRVYYVAEGRGEFILRGESVMVAEGDVMIIPKDTEYDFWAGEGQTLKLFLVNAPAFDPDAEVRADR